MDNLRGLLGIRRMDRVLNAWIREMWNYKGETEGLIRVFGGLAMWRVYLGVCASSHLVGRLKKRWNDTEELFKVWMSGK